MTKYSLEDYMEIIRRLRGENGCSWDRAQTHESLKTCLIEECYEVVEAINNKDSSNLKEELGDLLLQVAIHTAIAEEEKEFTIEEVISEAREKMIRRHPHVFGNGKQQSWEEIKRQEKKEKCISEGMIKVPKIFPSNIRAEKIQKKAAKAGVEVNGKVDAFQYVNERLKSLQIYASNGNNNKIKDEFGELMFSIVNLSRFLNLNAENSLTNATDKFINRFVDTERIAKVEGRSLDQLPIDELEALWGRVKLSE